MIVALFGSHDATYLWAFADSEGPDQPAHLAFHCTLIVSLDTTEYINGEQRPV